MFFARPQMLDHKRVAVSCSIKAATSKGGLEAGRRGEDFRGGGFFKDPRMVPQANMHRLRQSIIVVDWVW
jgi:hypothetical protein